jgi:hypothetical protein
VAAAAPAAAAERPLFLDAHSKPGNGAATVSLILGIFGLVLLLLSLGFGVLSLPLSVAAWITGHRGRRRVARGETAEGDGIAHAGVILGIVGVVLALIGIVVWVVLIAAGLDLEELQRDLERRSNPNADQALWLAAQAMFGR